MGRPKSHNTQVNISIPTKWKIELENLARIYSVDEQRTVTFLELMRRGYRRSISSENIRMTKPEDKQYHSSSHCLYLTQYHLIFCPKFRFPVLKDGVDEALKGILRDICQRYG